VSAAALPLPGGRAQPTHDDHVKFFEKSATNFAIELWINLVGILAIHPNPITQMTEPGVM
jgi:hypothetical protein